VTEKAMDLTAKYQVYQSIPVISCAARKVRHSL